MYVYVYVLLCHYSAERARMSMSTCDRRLLLCHVLLVQQTKHEQHRSFSSADKTRAAQKAEAVQHWIALTEV
jgi:hypothetical protein